MVIVPNDPNGVADTDALTNPMPEQPTLYDNEECSLCQKTNFPNNWDDMGDVLPFKSIPLNFKHVWPFSNLPFIT